jgi:hypothetical protein
MVAKTAFLPAKEGKNPVRNPAKPQAADIEW